MAMTARNLVRAAFIGIPVVLVIIGISMAGSALDQPSSSTTTTSPPHGEPIEVMSGHWRSVTWTLYAARTDDQVCIEFSGKPAPRRVPPGLPSELSDDAADKLGLSQVDGCGSIPSTGGIADPVSVFVLAQDPERSNYHVLVGQVSDAVQDIRAITSDGAHTIEVGYQGYFVFLTSTDVLVEAVEATLAEGKDIRCPTMALPTGTQAIFGCMARRG